MKINKIIKSLIEKKSVSLEDLPVQHDWQLISKSYAPPRRDIPVEKLPPELVQKAIFGVTVYLWQCKNTGEIRKDEVLGSDENQLLDLIEKAEKYGIQYIKEGQSTYAVAKVPPESAGVPLK